MSFLDGILSGDNRDRGAKWFAEVAGGLLEIPFDEWGPYLFIVGGLVLVVFVAVSLFGFLLSGGSFKGLDLR